jgi:hypothetical protein
MLYFKIYRWAHHSGTAVPAPLQGSFLRGEYDDIITSAGDLRMISVVSAAIVYNAVLSHIEFPSEKASEQKKQNDF